MYYQQNLPAVLQIELPVTGPSLPYGFTVNMGRKV